MYTEYTACPTRYRNRLAGGPLFRVATNRRTTDTHYRHKLQTRTTDTHYRHALQIRTTDTHYRHTLQTHTTDTHYRHTLQTRTTDTLQTHSFSFLTQRTYSCNIFIGVRIIKEMPGSVASGTYCIFYVALNDSTWNSEWGKNCSNITFHSGDTTT